MNFKVAAHAALYSTLKTKWQANISIKANLKSDISDGNSVLLHDTTYRLHV